MLPIISFLSKKKKKRKTEKLKHIFTSTSAENTPPPSYSAAASGVRLSSSPSGDMARTSRPAPSCSEPHGPHLQWRLLPQHEDNTHPVLTLLEQELKLHIRVEVSRTGDFLLRGQTGLLPPLMRRAPQDSLEASSCWEEKCPGKASSPASPSPCPWTQC